MARLAALVLGSLTISFPPTGQNCLSMRSFPVAKSRSSHRRASSSPPAHPGGQVQQEQLVHSSALAWMRNRRISSWVSTCISLPLMGGEPAPGRRIAVDQFRLHRPVQGHLADSVAASHRAVCHALSTLFRIVLSAALLHGPKELLEVSLGQPVELDAAQAGDQVVIDPALIAQLGGGPEPWLGKILVPVVQSCPKGHIRPYLSGAVVAALLLQLFQLLHAFLLRLGQHIFLFWDCRPRRSPLPPGPPSGRPSKTDGTLAPFSLFPAMLSPHHDTFYGIRPRSRWPVSAYPPSHECRYPG